MKYRKKPVVVEAFQYDGDFKNSKGQWYIPQWATDAHMNGILYFNGHVLKVKTLEGDMTASVGDYIIQGVNGEIYPCKPDIFEKTYESAEKGCVGNLHLKADLDTSQVNEAIQKVKELKDIVEGIKIVVDITRA